MTPESYRNHYCGILVDIPSEPVNQGIIAESRGNEDFKEVPG